MLEWELILERLQASMNAEETLHEAEDASANRATIEPFEAEMEALGDRLEWFQNVLAHVDQYALEELVDAFLTKSGNSSSYHRFVHNMPLEKK